MRHYLPAEYVAQVGLVCLSSDVATDIRDVQVSEFSVPVQIANLEMV